MFVFVEPFILYSDFSCIRLTVDTDGIRGRRATTIPVHRLNGIYNYLTCSRDPVSTTVIEDERNFVVVVTPSYLVKYFRFIPLPELRKACLYHGISSGKSARLEDLRGAMLMHECVSRCSGITYAFRERPRPRTNVEWKFTSSVVDPTARIRREGARVTSRAVPNLDDDEEDPSSDINGVNDEHLNIASEELRLSIIDDWQTSMSSSSMRRRGCAVCARLTPENAVERLNACSIPLELLRNDDLPEHILPTEYNLAAYDMAILHPPGLSKKASKGHLTVCHACADSLRGHAMPKFALANWLYYGHAALPSRVKAAFDNASPFDLMLVARARASNICFRFGSYFGVDDDSEEGERVGFVSRARKGVRGNIMVTPLDATKLSTVLPPDPQSIADTVCAVFVGKTMPSRSTIAKLSPVLVRKSRVKVMIEFLLKRNPHYQLVDGFKGFSAVNLNKLFGKETGDDEGVPTSMELCHLPLNDAVDSATSDYTGRNEYDVGTGGILMENVGFTSGDDTPQSYREMKMKALGHCLSGGLFVSSRHGSNMVPDFDNPYLLSWLFPHLDPWGIGGFHHPKRRIRISMDEQLTHLLQLDGGRFERDPEFAFVYYNIRRKKLVSQNVRFRVPQNRYNQIIKDLLDVDVERLLALQSLFKRNPMYRPVNEKESSLVRLLAHVSMVGSNIPGSAAYKVSLRNEIRAVINYRGTPTLFVTLNPSDVDHPLVRLNAGHDIDLDDIARGEDLDKWSRMLLAARNPCACALFFDSMISNFISIILRAGSRHGGLFGICSSYYGTVEANGRGTLHCHMLIWLSGHPSPQVLRDRMNESPDYKDKTFRWLESIIKCELLGTDEVVVERSGPLPRPKRSLETGNPHPGTIPAPLVKGMTSERQFDKDFEEFVNSLVKEYNWHVHTSSCWKHLSRQQKRDDHNCRMGIDGHTLPKTILDPDTFSILLKRLHPRIAAYNDVVIFLVKCNMDIKFIGSGEAAKAYLYYITDYITKPSLPIHVGLAALSYAVKRTNTKFPRPGGDDCGLPEGYRKSAMIITVNSMMGHQEISHQQVLSYLVGGGDHYTPDIFQTLHWGAFKSLAKKNDEASLLEGGGVHEGLSVVLSLGRRSITASNQVLDYVHRGRGETFENMCLYEFVEKVIKVAIPEASRELIRAGRRDALGEIPGEFSSSEHPQYGTHVLRVRVRTVIPVILGDKIARPTGGADELELWSRDIMVLFVPWRDIGDLKEGFPDWTHAYVGRCEQIKSKYKRIVRNLNVLSECRDARGELARKWHDERRKDNRRFEVDDAIESMLGLDEEERVNIFDAFGMDDKDQVSVGFRVNDTVASELGARNNRLLDYCLPLNSELPSTTFDRLGEASELLPEDEGEVISHSNIMLTLKRKRRPEHIALPMPLPKRRRFRLEGDDALVYVSSVDGGRGIPVPIDKRENSGAPSNDPRWELVREVVCKMNMDGNDEQRRALTIMAKIMIEGGPQLLMYVSGVGGTGKSHLIKALVTLFQKLGRRDELLLGAPTGIAAVLIGGYTMHALSMTNPHRKSKDVQELISLWRGVRFLVIDEISMVGSLFLSQFSARLKQAMSDDATASGRPFGGVNVIFMGDFGQLKPPRQHSLFAYQLVDNPSFEESRDERGISAMNGAFLWRQVNVVVKLTKNHRHHEDPDYASLLDRIRIGLSRPNSSTFLHSTCTDDLAFLRAREISRIADCDPESLAEFRDAPVIVGSREVRDAINAKYVAFHARRLFQAVHVYHSVDTIKRAAVSGALRDKLWKKVSRETNDSLGRLPLFPGMKVMVTENIAFTKGIVNGVEGVVENIKYTVDEEGNRFASVVYIRVSDIDMEIAGLDRGLVPIFPETVSFEYKYKTDEGVKTRTVTRKQLPILPSYSYTDFKSQGRTLERAIVDLCTARGQGVYVMLSRVKSVKGLAILRWFPATKVFQRPSEDVRKELDRIDFLDSTTKRAYDAGRL